MLQIDDDVIRRQILGMSPDDSCNTDQSFSFRIALRYLGDMTRKLTPSGLQIGSVLFKKLEYNSGGYQLPIKETLGYQILLNYRRSSPEQVPLRKILNGDLDSQLSQLIGDRIVLIGVAKKTQDLHDTPYSMGQNSRRMPGVFLHGQMISHIISAVLDGQPLLWWWPEWLENVWIVSWSDGRGCGGLGLAGAKRCCKQFANFQGSENCDRQRRAFSERRNLSIWIVFCYFPVWGLGTTCPISFSVGSYSNYGDRLGEGCRAKALLCGGLRLKDNFMVICHATW